MFLVLLEIYQREHPSFVMISCRCCEGLRPTGTSRAELERSNQAREVNDERDTKISTTVLQYWEFCVGPSKNQLVTETETQTNNLVFKEVDDTH